MTDPMKCPDCKELVSRIYWLKDQLPPRDWECRCGHEENMKGHWSQQLDDDSEAIEEFCVF